MSLFNTILSVAVAATAAFSLPARAINIHFDSLPDVQLGQGRTVATYSDIATVDGQGVDMKAELVSQAPQTAKLFGADSGALTFAFTESDAGQTQVATVRYSFYKKGTTDLISLDDVKIMVDGLVDGSGHICSILTPDAVSYTVEKDSTLLVDLTAHGLEVVGMQTVDTDSAPGSNRIQIDFGTCQELTISYGCDFQSATPAKFSITGSKSASFSAPQTTPLTIPDGPQHIYYTYDFENSASVYIPVDFADELPDGLAWDAGYVPVFKGDLTGDLVYLNGDREATMSSLKLPPGSSSVTLCTQPVALDGEILNNARLTFMNGSVLVAANGGTKITLAKPVELSFTSSFAKSRVAGYAVLVTGGQFSLDGSKTRISGDVGIGRNVFQDVYKGIIEGDYFVHPPASGSTGFAVDSSGGPVQPMLRDFDSLKEEALALSNQAAALTPTQTIGGSGAMTIQADAPDGMNVILFESGISLSGHADLVLSGGAGDYFILNIKSGAKFTGFGRIVLHGGVTASHVLINLLPGAGTLKVAGKGGITGAVLAVQPGNRVEISGGSDLPVSIAADAISVVGNSTIAPYRFK